MERAQLCAQTNKALPAILRQFCPPSGDVISSTRHNEGGGGGGGGGGLHLDPDQLEYLRQLIAALYEGRAVVASYNIIIIAVILVLAYLHRRETKSDREKWKRISQSTKEIDHVVPSTESPSPSSSSTPAGTLTPSGASKDLRVVDIEQLPLLPDGRGASKLKKKKRSKIVQSVSSWLAYQPTPIPIVNRVLPSNGTSLFILTWLAISLFFHLYRLPMRWDFFFIFADRAGLHFIVNLPLLYLLGAKNQPLRILTGYSYEALNIFHRRVGELICLEAVVHFVSMVVYQFFIAEKWLKATRTAREYFTHPIIVMGMAAFASYELLFFTSLGSFRQRWYELFLLSHVFLQAGALMFLWFHFRTSQPYVAVSLVIFLTDRLVWRFGLKRTTITADLTILDKETYLVSADWDISSDSDSQSQGRRVGFLSRHSILHGWEPTDHVFLTVPVLGRSHALQSHPFTIASAAPGRRSHGSNDEDPVQRPRHAWFSLLIRAHGGFTADLLRYAQSHHNRVSVQLDGPYGSPHALSMLRASRCAILVAGGSGIAVTFPLVWALLHEEEDGKVHNSDSSSKKSRRRKVCMLWVTHSRCHQEWIPREQLNELVARGLELVVPEPTAEKGRPDVSGIVGGWLESAADGQYGNGDVGDTSVVVSGPDGLNRTVRNLCSDAIGKGQDVRIAVEKFGW